MMILGWTPATAQELRAPERLWECEGSDHETCGTWVFHGAEGTGQWSNGAAATLVIQQFDPARIIIRREDPAGTSTGLTGVYVGKLSGDRIEGTVTWTWLGHWNRQIQGTWSASLHEPGSGAPAPSAAAVVPPIGQETLEPAAEPSRREARDRSPEPPEQARATAAQPGPGLPRPTPEEPPGSAPALPGEMHVCVSNCSTFTLKDGRYTNVSDGGGTTLTIETFTADRVVLHRTDRAEAPGKALTAVYVGQISPDGNGIADGTVHWTSVFSGTAYFSAAWGDALDSLPGNNATIPTQLVECEGKRCDGAWTFSGRQGTARWSSGAVANLVIARYGPAGVVIQRVDPGGSSPGLTAVYTGQIHGDRIQGDVTWSWYGRWPHPRSGTWSATIGRAVSAVPPSGAAQPALPGTPHSRELLVPSMGEPTAAIRSRKLDLSGDWSGYYNSPALPHTIRVRQQGQDLAAEDLLPDRTPTGRQFFRGTYDPPAVAGRVELAGYEGLGLPSPGAPPSRWTAATLTIGDPDHFRLGDHPPFQRMTAPRLNDVPCDAGNPLHVQAKFATYRGERAHNAKDWKTALCWFRIGAEQGDTYAEYILASYLEQGIGCEKDLAQALSWFRRSADEGDSMGAAGLEKMYRNGIGVPQDAAQADSWRLRTQALQAQVNNDALLERQAEKKEQKDIAILEGMLTFSAAMLVDPGPPAPCKTLALYSHLSNPSIADETILDQTRRQIQEQHIQCPPD